MVEEEKVPFTQEIEKELEIETEKWLEVVASAQMKEGGTKTLLFIVMVTDVTLPYIKVSFE
jgi:hypothetical protein